MKKIFAAILTLVLMSLLFCAAAMAETDVTQIRLVDKGASLRDCPAGTKIGSEIPVPRCAEEPRILQGDPMGRSK